MDQISQLSSDLLTLKVKKSKIHKESSAHLKTKCDIVKKNRIDQYKKMSTELDAKERELCKKTNQLVDELVATCGDTPFHKALIKILRNLKGKTFLPWYLLTGRCSAELMNGRPVYIIT